MERYQPDDEIDLFELFASLVQQWHWVIGLTVVGVVVSVIVALQMPKQYEVTAQIAVPNQSDVMALTTRGYGKQAKEALFAEFYNSLNSPRNIDDFILEGQWPNKLLAGDISSLSDSEVTARVRQDFSIEIFVPKKEKGVLNTLAPSLLALTLWSTEEQHAADMLNSYIEKSNQQFIELIKSKAIKAKDLELERVSREIDLLRITTARNRALLIQKIEATNGEKLKKLSQALELSVSKFSIDQQASLAELNEALVLALKLKINKPTTIEAFAKGSISSSATEINVTTNTRSDLFLMGSDYIKGVILNLKSRTEKELFIKEISGLKKQIEETKHDVTLAALKARKNDDPFIVELPALLEKLSKLDSISFDFSGVQLYRLDKAASIDGQAEKPKRALIVAVGGVLSLFIGIFAALIAGAVKRRKALA